MDIVHTVLIPERQLPFGGLSLQGLTNYQRKQANQADISITEHKFSLGDRNKSNLK